LTATTYDGATGTLSASGDAGEATDTGPLLAFHPGPTEDDVEVEVRGLDEPVVEEIQRGGVLISARPEGGPWELQVTPARS
jgi:hypothetical protein